MTKLLKRFRDFTFRYRSLDKFYGRDFIEILTFLKKSRYWSKDQILEYKFDRLSALLHHAEANVPYYKKLFKAQGITAGDIKSFEDYAKIPVLTKKDVQENHDDLKAVNFDSYNPVKAETAGTSGGATLLYRSNYLEAYRQAVVWRFYNEYGYNYRDKLANITNPHSSSADSPVAELDKINNHLIIDTFHIARRNLKPVLKLLREFKPKMIWTHPNMIGILAEYILDNDLEPIPIPLIATYALKFDPAVRKLCQKVFPGRYFEYYGNRENSIAAWGNSDGVFYEISEYCHFEIENVFTTSGQPDKGDLITTSLHNYAFPLIRYHSEDYVKMLGYIDEQIPYPAIDLIGGRGKDLLVTRQGLIDPYVLGYICRKGFDKIQSYQIKQLAIDKLLLRIVPKQNYNIENDEPILEQLLQEALPFGFKFEFKYVEHIPLTKSGKFQLVISDLAMDYITSPHLS